MLGWLQRTERDRLALSEPGAERGKTGLFAILLLALALFSGPVLIGQVLYWKSLSPEFPIDRDARWRVSYDDPVGACPTFGTASISCPAHPQSAKFQSEGKQRFPDGPHKERLQSHIGRAFWVGIDLEPEFLAKAAHAGARHLMVGHFWSKYEVWVDGRHLSEGLGIADPVPLIVPLTEVDLLRKTPLRIAIRTWHNGEYPAPDHLCDGLPPSLLTRATAAGYMTQISFWERVRPFALMLCYALIAGLFFFFWLPTPSRQEYSYLALFALASAAYQARWIDMVYWTYSRNAILTFDLFVNVYATGFAMLLGFAFARLRRSIFRVAVPLVIFLPILLTVASSSTAERWEVRRLLYLWLWPGAFMAGGFACLLQAVHLRKNTSVRLPHRMRRLTLFGIGMVGAAVFYFMLKRTVLAGSHRHYWNGFEHLVLLLYFGAIALREYGEHQVLVSRAPVSEYHRRPTLPERLKGTLLAMDLKSSELFYRMRASLGGEDLVSLWRSHVSAALSRHGGTIVLRKGDEIAAFFEGDQAGEASLKALRALEEAASDSALLAGEHRGQSHFPEDAEGFYFRASIAEGEVRPTWEQSGTHREAGWEGVGETNIFLECARLMEMEKKLPGAGTRCVMRNDLSERLLCLQENLAERLRRVATTIADKHGTLHHLACYVPLAADKLEDFGLARAPGRAA